MAQNIGLHPERIGLFNDISFSKKMLSELYNQRNTQFCDVILKVYNTEIHAHSNILAAASPYFRSFLDVGADFPRSFSHKTPQIIEIHIDTKDAIFTDDGYGEAVMKVIDFMYTSHISLTESIVGQIIEISKIMQMDFLLSSCYEFQSGVDTNLPCDQSTTTDGLEELADLMRASWNRSRSRKQIDVCTETDDNIFRKLEGVENDHQTTTLRNKTCRNVESNVTGHTENCSLTSNTIVEKYSLKSRPTCDSPLPCFIQDQISEMDTCKERVETGNINLQNSISFLDPQSQNISSKLLELKNHDPSEQSYEAEGIQLLEMNKSSDCNLSLPLPELNKEPKSITRVSPVPLVVEGVNLDEISDLVRFDTVPSKSTFHDFRNNLTRPAMSSKRGRGRPRGRGRRGPGRPRKVIKTDSDPEFDSFLEYLDKDSEEVDVDEKNIQNSDFQSETVVELKADNSEFCNGQLMRSKRKKSRPLQLKKDYVVHSLAKKKRNNYNRTYHTNKIPTEKDQISVSLQYMCEKCDFSSALFKEYRQHLRSHPEIDPRYFICDYAGCKFKTMKSRQFRAHKDKHKEEQMICPICEHKSDNLEDFKLHQSLHEGLLPFFCKECFARFKTKTQLLAHHPKHQLEKPFVCTICNAGFKWKHALRSHMVTHSKTKDHLCDECGYATAHKSQLKSHMLIHTGMMFRCPEHGCNFKATKRQNLKYHLVTHTQEKPHQCEVCGQSFSLVKNMKRHMLLHTGFRPFICRTCGFSTTRYDKLKEHNLKQHSLISPSTNLITFSEPGTNYTAHLQPESDVTYVSTTDFGGNITINSSGIDACCLSEEALQTLAQLAQTTVENHEGDNEDDADVTVRNIPIITTVNLEFLKMQMASNM